MAPKHKSDVPMILPKGIVVNTPNVYGDVARLATVPTEKAWEYWRIYTTTNKRLQDPTARRLENFWWHVIGSDRCHLSGQILAKIYEDISTGPTFVPLRGPPNRWEGPIDPTRLQKVQALLEAEQQLTPKNSETMSTPNMRPKDMPSSALRPPPSHPILKKPSGPQSTGPRPTARFVSPHVSEGETENQDDIPSSGSTVTPGLEMRLVTVKSPPKKKPSGAGRKFVASAGKRRPMIARKTSSHSAVGSADSGSTREEPTSSTTKNSRVLSQVASPVTEPFPTLNNNLLSAPVETPPKPSAKALGKRPVVPYTLPINSKPESSQQPSQKALCSSENKTALIMNPKLALTEEVPERLPSKEIKPILPTRPRPSPIQQPSQILSSSYESRSSAISLDKTPRSQRKQLDPSMTQQSVVRLPSHPQLAIENQKQRSDASDLSDSSTVVGSVRSPLCRTFSGLIRRESGFSQGLFTSATACTTNIEAHGAIIDQSGNTSPLPIAGQGAVRRFDGDMPMSPSSILDSHLTPTPPSNAPPVPLGRTRSQLNILLDRENERNARKSWARG